MKLDYLSIQAFIHREARLLDDRDWDTWLECYHPRAVFWMPAWDDENCLTEDPQLQSGSASIATCASILSLALELFSSSCPCQLLSESCASEYFSQRAPPMDTACL